METDVMWQIDKIPGTMICAEKATQRAERQARKGGHAHVWATVRDQTIEDGEQEGKGAQPSQQQECVKD